MFRKRNTKPLKALGYGLAAIILVGGGILAARWAMTDGAKIGPESSGVSGGIDGDTGESTQEPSTAETTVPTQSAEQNPDEISAGNLRAVYIPVSLLADSSRLDGFLDQAKAAGFNGVVFDLKDDRGCLQYASAIEQAEAVLKTQKSRLSADPSLTLEALTAAAQRIRDKEMVPVPRLYAFKDQIAPYALAAVKIGVEGGLPNTVWHDTAPDKGGKPWMNPCSSEAHRYMVSLASELKGMGFDLLMVDGVQFPDQEYSADYGSSDLASLKRDQILSRFVATMEEVMGGGLITNLPALAATGDTTTPFGGNPLTFGSPSVAPLIYASQWGSHLTVGSQTLENPANNPYGTAKLLLEHIHLRLQLMEEAQRPEILPFIGSVHEYQALTEVLGEDAPFVLYQEGDPDLTGFN